MGAKKPIASLCVVFYNQEDYVKDAIEGALSQTFDDCEIILSDDHSTDRTLERIKEVVSNYHGNKRIIINEHNHNLGLVPHINEVIYQVSSGRYIFLTGGDDISLPNRVKDGVEYFENNPDLSMVTFSTVYINENGVRIGGSFKKDDSIIKLTDKDYLCSDSFMAGLPGQGFRRDILEEYGPMGDCQTEDSVLRFRSIMKGPVMLSSRIGIKYRMHKNNISAPSRIYKLFDTEKIAEQYRKDLLAQKSYLDSSLFNLLWQKIDYYIRFRKISAKLTIHEMNVGIRYIYRGMHFLLRKFHEGRVVLYSKSLK